MPRRTRSSRLIFSIAVLLLVLLLSSGALMLRGARGRDAVERTATGIPLLAFAEFGQSVDRIYTSPASDPEQRTLVETIAHAEGWGINPAPQPAGSLFAYTVLPPGSPARLDSPAELWVSDLVVEHHTRVAADADLLVAPVLSRDGKQLVYRRSDQNTQALVVVNLATQLRSVVHREETAFGLLPVAFAPDGSILFARLSTSGTDLLRVRSGEAPARVFHASDSVARDWQLSPDERSLSYLAPEQLNERVVYRAHVVSLDGSEKRALPSPIATATEQYGPVWTPSGGALTVGQEAFETSRQSAAVIAADGSVHVLPAPARGFDVPLAWSQDGAYLVVRNFDGTNSQTPGNASIVVVGLADGRRTPLEGRAELTFIGWIGRA